jgi:hypothetical protein
MATGPRQDRIGNGPTGGEQQSARPGPDFTAQIAGAKRGAERAQGSRKSQGTFGSPKGSSTGMSMDRTR